MLVKLRDGNSLNIVLNVGEVEWIETWPGLLAGFNLAALASKAGSMMELLSSPFTPNSTSFEIFEKNKLAHKRRTGKDMDEEVAAGVVLQNMQDETPRRVLHARRGWPHLAHPRRGFEHLAHAAGDGFHAEGHMCDWC